MDSKSHARLAVDGFIFDLDGTIYLGEEALPGAVGGVRELREHGKRVIFVSNKPLAPRAAYADKLTRLGIPTTEDQVITSAFVLAHHLARGDAGAALVRRRRRVLKAEGYAAGHGLTVVEELLSNTWLWRTFDDLVCWCPRPTTWPMEWLRSIALPAT